MRCGGSDIVMGIFMTSEKHGNKRIHQVCLQSADKKKTSEEKVLKKIASQQFVKLFNFLPTNTLVRLQPNHQAAKYHTDWKPMINTESQE